MHTYSTDNDLRPKIIAFLGIGSYIFVRALANVLPELNRTLPYGIELSAPATGLVFTVVYFGFGGSLWDNRLFRAAGIVKAPNLDGEWTGKIQSSFEEGKFNGDHDIEVTIHQTWRKICVELETPKSTSRSLGATILTQQGKPQLTYYYRSEPKYDAPDSMSIHYGTASLKFHSEADAEGNDVLKGIYYTSPDRESHGQMRLTREGKSESMLQHWISL